MRRSKRISLRIPPGVDTGSRLRVKGEGDAGRRGGPPGDLYVFISVQNDPDLKRDGINISTTVTIPYTDAILGTSCKVRTVDGPVDLKIPAGVQPGAVLLMAKRGVPRLSNPSMKARPPSDSACCECVSATPGIAGATGLLRRPPCILRVTSW